MGPPTVVDAGPVLVTDRSVESADTDVLADAELFSSFGSHSLPATLFPYTTLFRSAGAVALMVNVELAPLARLPAAQVTVPALLVQPALADTKRSPEHTAELQSPDEAVWRPLLVAVTV